MTSIILVVFGIVFISTVQSQVWTGNYNLDSSCNPGQCCCLTGQLAISQVASSVIRIVANTNGRCGSSNRFDVTIGQPVGYLGYLQAAAATWQIQLSSNSQTITIQGPTNPMCTSLATKIA